MKQGLSLLILIPVDIRPSLTVSVVTERSFSAIISNVVIMNTVLGAEGRPSGTAVTGMNGVIISSSTTLRELRR